MHFYRIPHPMMLKISKLVSKDFEIVYLPIQKGIKVLYLRQGQNGLQKLNRKSVVEFGLYKPDSEFTEIVQEISLRLQRAPNQVLSKSEGEKYQGCVVFTAMNRTVK